MKWLDPKIHPIPEDTTVIACLFSGKRNYSLCIQKSSFSGDYFPMIVGNDEDYFCTEDAKIPEEEIIAWMPLPNAPEEVSCPEIPDNS